jgi:hypothetical protein
MRKEAEERIREEMEGKMVKRMVMFRGSSRKIPKAPPPPPVVDLYEEACQLQDYGEVENIVLDTGMHTVKVDEIMQLHSNQS